MAELHLERCAECRDRVAQFKDARACIAPVSAATVDSPARECPEMEELASYAIGGDDIDRREWITDHVVGCDRCAAILRDSLDAVPDIAEVPARSRGVLATWHVFTGRRYWKYAIAAGVVFVIGGSVALWQVTRPIPELQTRATSALLAQAYTDSRQFEYRLPDAGYTPVQQMRGPSVVFARSESLDSAVAAIRRELAVRPNAPLVFQLKGRAELLGQDYDSAIKSLEQAKSSNESNPDVLADLGTAYAVRGEAERRNADYGHAVELFLAVLKKRPGESRTLFNLALTYEKLSLVDEAIETWNQFLKGNRDDGWRREAQSHLREMESAKARKKKSDERILHDPGKFLAAFGGAASFDPLSWYDVFWIEWLPRAASDPIAADAARLIAAGFARLGEFSLLESVDAPSSAAKDDGLRSLASAMAANRKGHAGDALTPALHAAGMLQSAGLKGAAALARNEYVYAARWAAMNLECLETANSVLHSLGPRYPWIEGNAHLEHAGCLQRLGETGPARVEVAAAGTRLSKAGLWPAALRPTRP